MNRLNSISNFRKNIKIIGSDPNNVQNVASIWTVLNTGLSSSYKIGRPTKYAIEASEFYTFAITGGTQKTLRYSIFNGSFNSSSVDINVNDPLDVVREYTNLTNSAPNTNIYGVFRGTYSVGPPASYIMRVRRGLNGAAYITPAGGGFSSNFEENIKIHLNTYDDRLFAADVAGYFAHTVDNGSLSVSNYTGANSFFTDRSCTDVLYDGTSFILFGGTGSTSKIVKILRTSLVGQTAAWTNISNSFGQGISKAGLVEVYLNYSQPEWLQQGTYLVTTSSYSKILLIGGLNGKIARSIDGGNNWSDSSTQPFLTTDVVTGFASGHIAIFATTNTGKIARSMDAGVNWTLLNIGVYPSNIGFAQSIISSDNQHKIFIGGSNAFLASWNYEPITYITS
jgi:hypothetical protein